MRLGIGKPAIVAVAFLAVAGCTAGATQHVYVLGDTAAPGPAEVSQLKAPTIEVQPVQVPDYLDTTSILTRGAGGLMVPSPTGRWGERLSIGIARAVQATLARRLPHVAVTTSQPLRTPRWLVRIAVEAFSVRPDQGGTLVAQWTLIDGRNGRPFAEEREVLDSPGPLHGDAAVVAAMSQQVNALANRIADSLAAAGHRRT